MVRVGSSLFGRIMRRSSIIYTKYGGMIMVREGKSEIRYVSLGQIFESERFFEIHYAV